MTTPSPYDGHRFGLESPVGTRRVRGPTLFVLGLMGLVALAAILRAVLS
jgi:hypothetical protein